MGLRKRGETMTGAAPGIGRHWWAAAILLLFCVALGALGDAGRELLRYDRPAIVDGDYWRLVTGHFAHLGVSHLMLNMAGLVLVWLLVGRYLSAWQWLLATLVTIVVTDLGFWFVDTNLLWYVGFSGVLHGLLLAGAAIACVGWRSEAALLIALVVAKLGWEQLAGPLPGSETASGGNVIVNAHLYGAIGGLVAAGLLWRRARPGASI